MGFYAVGFGDWVEIREALKSPKAHTTEVDRGFMKERVPNGPGEYYYDTLGRYRYKEPTFTEKMTPVKIQITGFEGGRVRRVINFSKLYKLIKLHVHKDQMVKLTVPQAKVVLEWKG